MNNIKLTIGMAHYDDFDGAFFTINSIRMNNTHLLNQLEFLVIDNNPKSKQGQALNKFMRKPSSCKMTYIPFTDSVGTSQSRNKIFEMASGEYVLCLDCHVLLKPDAIEKLLKFYCDDPKLNLYSGPLIRDNFMFHTSSTHFDPYWNGFMFGKWGTALKSPEGIHCNLRQTDKKESYIVDLISGEINEELTNKYIDSKTTSYGITDLLSKRFALLTSFGEPFEIPSQGLGLFTCKKSEWLGFNPDFRGFGGEEGYIHEKYRQAGKKTECLPFLGWNHRFERPEGAKYPLQMMDRVRNYVIGWKELGLPLKDIYQHFVSDPPHEISERNWEDILKDLENPGVAIENTTISIGDVVSSKFKGSLNNYGLPEKLYFSEALFDWFRFHRDDIGHYLPRVRRISDECESFVEITNKFQSSFGPLASKTEKLVTYFPNPGDFHQEYSLEFPKWNVFDSSDYELDTDSYDGMYINEVHDHEVVFKQLEFFEDKVNKYIVLGDSQMYGLQSSPDSAGIGLAVYNFIKQNPEWYILDHDTVSHGITILSKLPEKRPEKEIKPWVPMKGAGTQLKKRLSWIGIKATPNCSCNKRAVLMDIRGPKWCRDNVDEIVSWLKEEATKRSLPFSEFLAKKLVMSCIKAAEREL